MGLARQTVAPHWQLVSYLRTYTTLSTHEADISMTTQHKETCAITYITFERPALPLNASPKHIDPHSNVHHARNHSGESHRGQDGDDDQTME